MIAGGQAVFNPEPVAPFVDAFAIGEGEEVTLDIVGAHQDWVESGGSRQELLLRLAQIPGVYVPALVKVDYHPDGKIKTVEPADARVKLPVVKRILAKLPRHYRAFWFPTSRWCTNAPALRLCAAAHVAAAFATRDGQPTDP